MIENSVCLVVGSPESVERASAFVLEQVKSYNSDSWQSEPPRAHRGEVLKIVPVPGKHIGKIIGAQGASINKVSTAAVFSFGLAA
jgi:hypothetical protein